MSAKIQDLGDALGGGKRRAVLEAQKEGVGGGEERGFISQFAGPTTVDYHDEIMLEGCMVCVCARAHTHTHTE